MSYTQIHTPCCFLIRSVWSCWWLHGIPCFSSWLITSVLWKQSIKHLEPNIGLCVLPQKAIVSVTSLTSSFRCVHHTPVPGVSPIWHYCFHCRFRIYCFATTKLPIAGLVSLHVAETATRRHSIRIALGWFSMYQRTIHYPCCCIATATCIRHYVCACRPPRIDIGSQWGKHVPTVGADVFGVATQKANSRADQNCT